MPYWPNWINNILLKCNVFGGLVYGRSYLRLKKTMGIRTPEEQLLQLVNFAIQNVSYYRKRYSGLRLSSIKDFEDKIGFIDKDEVMAHWDEFVADDIDWKKCNIGTTGGTSGKPLKLVIPKNRYAREKYFGYKYLSRYGWSYHTRAILRNHHLPENRDYIINPILKEIIFDPFRMNADYARRIWQTMRKFDIHFILAYPSAVFQFLKLCYNQGLDVSFLKACFLASEGVTPEQRAFIEGVLRVKLFSFFGHSEKLIYAGSTPDDSAYEVEEYYGYLEIIDEQYKPITEAGRIGEMVGTTFFNYSFPLIRYRTGDYSSYKEAVSVKPRKLNGVQGRWDKSLIYKSDGTTISTAAINLHSDVYTHIDGLQYVQDKIGEIIVLIIKNEAYIPEDHDHILDHIRKAMGENSIVSIKYVDRLIYQPNGKFLLLISKINKG